MDINMLMWVIAVSMGIVVYSSITILFSDTSKERIRSRVDNLVKDSDMDKIHAEVMNEKSWTGRRKRTV